MHMIEVELYFNEEEAISLFERAGLKVVQEEIPYSVGKMDCPYTEHFVINPFNGSKVVLKNAFREIVRQRNKELYVNNVNKGTILQIFNN